MQTNNKQVVTVGEVLKQNQLEPKIARRLLAHILKLNEADLYAHPERQLTDLEYQIWISCKDCLVQGEPLAYVLGEQEFYGRSFLVTPDVLIPRPETEKIVDLVLSNWLKKRQEKVAIAEIGVGSGALIISLVKELILRGVKPANLSVVGTDLSLAALSIAKENANRHGVTKSIEFRQGDLCDPLGAEKFDVIVANLPYLPSFEAKQNKFEPQRALDGGASGNDLVDQFLNEVKAHLKDDGTVIYETYGGEVIHHS